MKRNIIITEDGSSTIYFPEWDEHYHSKHGAIQEAYHVFLEKGLYHLHKRHPTLKKIAILEIGFGTGLNTFITYLEAKKRALKINYTGVEAYPIDSEEISQLNYVSQLKAAAEKDIFEQLHTSKWEETTSISATFYLKKRKQFFKNITDENAFNLIYFDAFGARVQPDLWTEEIFAKMYKALKPQGILTTYAAKGSVRRAMQTVGFNVERLEGPPGKREMLRATRCL